MDPAKILVVEDERIVQLHLSTVVESLGHAVAGRAGTPDEALEAARACPPDLVLMDIRLGDGGDGVDTATRLQREHGCSVLFLTANSDAASVTRASAASPAGYVIKPFTSAEVAASITTALASHERQRTSRARERALEAAVGIVGEALLVVDERRLVRFANARASALTGWSEGDPPRDAEELLGMVSPEARERLVAGLGAVHAGGGPVELAGLALAPRGRPASRFDVSLEASPTGSGPGPWCLVTLRGASAPTTTSAPRRRSPRFGPGTRLLVYSHDTFGLGHLRRCLNLIRALAERHPGLSTLLVTGSPLAHGFELPPGTDYVKLPAVRKVAASSYEARFLSMSDDGVQALRASLILRTVQDYDPDVLLADHSPTGMNGELLPALEWLSEQGRCQRILGLRDIIDAPERVVERWEADDVYGALRDHYEHVVVYGSRGFYDTVNAYRIPADIAARTHYLNHVTRGPAAGPASAPDPGRIVVSIGGGDGGADTVLVPFLRMLRDHHAALGIRADVLLGPFSAPAQRAELERRAAGLPVTLHSFVQDPAELFARAELVVATAGYNTSVELLAHAHRALFVPRVLHRQEQLLRAERLAELGLAGCLHPDAAAPERLLEEVVLQLRDPVGPLARARAEGRVPLDGAERFAEFCGALALDGAPLART